MKYIRTEDEIYEGVGTDAFGLKCVRYKGNVIVLSQDDDKIVKEADTIEELCDEFILFYKDIDSKELVNNYIPWSTYERRSDWWDRAKRNLIRELNNPNKKALVYGAIWTEWGLKYVAKVNEKWELELL